MHKYRLAALRIVCFGLVACAALSTGRDLPAQVLIKNVTEVEGDRNNLLIGMGLVIGLSGTGGKAPVTRQFALNMLQRFGLPADAALRAAILTDTRQKTDNISVVGVMADLHTSTQPGSEIDVEVSAFDDASSLQGGLLAATPLFGLDGEVYAVARGDVSTGGFAFAGEAANVQKNFPTTGRARAVVERQLPDCRSKSTVQLILREPDYSTAVHINDAINTQFPAAARVLNASVVVVNVPLSHLGDRNRFIASIQQLPIIPDVKARVVINNRTGTVVIGDNVRLSRVAVTHANLSVVTGETPQVSQPAPFSEGRTAIVPRTEIDVVEETDSVKVINEPATVADLAKALNALGVSPRDLSAIFEELSAAGALHAELITK